MTYDRGWMECLQDRCENVPFAGIGGLGARNAPTAPDYVPEADRAEFLRGYLANAQEMYGDDWRTCAFGWRHALTIEPDAALP